MRESVERRRQLTGGQGAMPDLAQFLQELAAPPNRALGGREVACEHLDLPEGHAAGGEPELLPEVRCGRVCRGRERTSKVEIPAHRLECRLLRKGDWMLGVLLLVPAKGLIGGVGP